MKLRTVTTAAIGIAGAAIMLSGCTTGGPPTASQGSVTSAAITPGQGAAPSTNPASQPSGTAPGSGQQNNNGSSSDGNALGGLASLSNLTSLQNLTTLGNLTSLAGAAGGQNAAGTLSIDHDGTYTCTSGQSVSLATRGSMTVTLNGPCGTVTIASGGNTVTIQNAAAIDIPAGGNSVTYGGSPVIDNTGTGNTVDHS